MVELEAYRNCRLCPRQCGVNRKAGEKGRCGEDVRLNISFMGPHHGEEPPISGTRGSGTVFFSGCAAACFFCQNYQISLEHKGDILPDWEFLERCDGLCRSGVHNLNFVTGDHYWPHIRQACTTLRDRGIHTPFLMNTSGYVDSERVDEWAQIFDLFLPDYKYADPVLALEIMGDDQYPRIALSALERMVKAKGFLDHFNDDGQTATRGVLVRHLVLPGFVDNSIKAMEALYRAFGAQLPISLMSQYAPTPRAAGHIGFCRRLTRGEYEKIREKIDNLGFENVFMQQLHGDDDYLPDFDKHSPFPGNP